MYIDVNYIYATVNQFPQKQGKGWGFFKMKGIAKASVVNFRKVT